jgi:hypothetical protein
MKIELLTWILVQQLIKLLNWRSPNSESSLSCLFFTSTLGQHATSEASKHQWMPTIGLKQEGDSSEGTNDFNSCT